MNTFSRARILVGAALTLLLLIGVTSSVMAAVWTDKEDYSPGSTVTIAGDNRDGAGYLDGERRSW
jgi:hypothetical protein